MLTHINIHKHWHMQVMLSSEWQPGLLCCCIKECQWWLHTFIYLNILFQQWETVIDIMDVSISIYYIYYTYVYFYDWATFESLQLTLWPPNYSIGIFTHLKLCLADAIHNFKWVKIIQIWQKGGQLFSNLAGWCHILSVTYLKCGTYCANKKRKPEYMRHRRLKG